MGVLQNKIDFSLLVTAKNANPNGDPLNGNRPRENYDGLGEISDVCIKRKIRNRLQDMGEKIFVQSDDRCDDGFDSLRARADGNEAIKAISKGKNTDRDEYAKTACAEWIDVRSFGQVFAFKGDAVSVGVRGPVSIQQAVSVSPVDIVSMQITKSVNSEGGKEGKASDTMGMKHRVEFGLYVINGSINCQLAEKTGFTDEDAEKIKQALLTLFENDTSSARPDGSMEVCRLYWWKHEGKTPKYSSAKVHRQLVVKLKDGVSRPTSFDDYDVELNELDGLACEKYEDLI
ncbi:type I-C CRISPR-associated protein Cas7/Csd2 [Ruminococcus flavefaciens]|jgi:CRISPR-associated protein Csd2|uniref:CRISPR-associated protein Csd2 n=1 Tax=Ruminococcus flavefaciens TaxID=1265 RepID=A0A315XY28_RUMFL|nr:type I-C CRISPR-associated protein Cas7/Csd2 [Ruminococcus flavefaciens]PWJ12150.1 CRISPR-associated protein Csd2 [Ruminococcus flavefaciens]SSA49638.1 CRISPR-associated protein Csd2 [Ruminococcus flavefaciens]